MDESEDVLVLLAEVDAQSLVIATGECVTEGKITKLKERLDGIEEEMEERRRKREEGRGEQYRRIYLKSSECV